jgi:hypothetical protein
MSVVANCTGEDKPDHRIYIGIVWAELIFCSCACKIPIPFPCLFPDLEVSLSNYTGSDAFLVRAYKKANQ